MTTPVPSATRRSKRLPALAFVAGALPGAAVVGLVWFLTAGGEPDGAVADARAACAAFERTDETVRTYRDDKDEFTALQQRLGAAAALARSAAAVEGAYQPLADALAAPSDIVTRTFDTRQPEYAEAMATARQACADL